MTSLPPITGINNAYGSVVLAVPLSNGDSTANAGHIVSGGVVQFVTLTLGAPPNGYELQNCDPTTYLFLSEFTSVWANGPAIPNFSGQNFPGFDGWNIAPPDGGGYYSPIGYQPNPPRGIAIYSPLTNHRFVWKSW